MTRAQIASLLAGLGLCAVVASPVLRSPLHDGFPLSRYPMFSHPRPDKEEIVVVEAWAGSGERRVLPSEWWSPGGGYTRGRDELREAVARGEADMAELCEGVAQRILESEEDWAAQVKRVRIVRGRFELQRYFGEGDRRVRRRKGLHECEVPR